ncbi:MAG TPA: hypothetical protein DHW42_03230 [Candidatus Marinimicrobia bacterium]|nr:hypothetical protein [Candidatus Neomarinimicrobiota bacterium]
MRTYQNNPRFLLALAPVILTMQILFYGCAAQGPPGGGPEDKTGPELLSVFPENGATKVNTATEIVLLFSEAIEPRSAENNLAITPAQKKPPKIKVNRKKVTISFYDLLEENTTYIIGFGRNIKDYRKNSTPDNITTAFATGDSLDQGQISGQVFKIPKNSYTTVWAFKKTETFPDSILGARPDYVTSVGADGKYRFANLAVGEYRLLAIASQTPRFSVITAENPIALPAVDPVIIKRRDTVINNINFRLGKLYINRFRIQSGTVNENRLELSFSRALDTQKSKSAKIKIIGMDQSPVQSFWINDADSRFANIIFSGLTTDREYTLVADGIVDDFGEDLRDPDNAMTFTYIEKADTIKPKLDTTVPAKDGRDIDTSPEIRLNFTESVIIKDPLTSIQINGPDSLPIPFRYNWLDGNSLLLTPENTLESKSEYMLIANTAGWADFAGNIFHDSLLTLSFTTLDINSFGSITGKVQTMDLGMSQNITIGYQSGPEGLVRTVRPLESGQYEIVNLLPGKYRFSIWEDRNGNGCWDPGRLMPFQAAEPFRSYSDEINVRARWETAEVNWNY